MTKFPLLRFAFEAIAAGGNMPCILNAANEVAVAAFLNRRIKFMDIPRLVENVMNETPYISKVSLDDLVSTNAEARARAEAGVRR